jgi:hypothetical protein
MEKFVQRRTKEDYTNPKLTKCFWMTEEYKKKNDAAVKKLLGNKKKPTRVPKKTPPFYYINDDTKPYLVLFCKISEDFPTLYDNNKLKNPEKWIKIFHQTAGYACHHHFMDALFLNPTKKGQALMDELVEKYNDSCISNPTLETANEYEAILKKFGFSANRTAFELEEGFYPIDIEFLNKLSLDKFPKNLQELCVPRDTTDKKALKRWIPWRHFELAILGPNCD